MDRRNFLSTSLTASALSLADVAAAPSQSPAAGPKAAVEFYDLRRYQLANGPGTKLTDHYLTGALIPALNRLGIGPVGAFSVWSGHARLLPPTAVHETRNARDGRFLTGEG